MLKSKNPKVTIVVPVYGVEQYLQRCIDSLVGQTFKDIEIILVDDGSKDSSGDICDENSLVYPDLLRVVHQSNIGLGGARNTGIKMARGEYLMFVDSDDYLRQDAVELAFEAIFQLEVDMVAFGVHLVNEGGRIIKSFYDGEIYGSKTSIALDKTILLSSPSAWNKIYRTHLFGDNNIWFPDRAWHEDVRTSFKIYAAASNVAFIQDYLYYYVQRNESITHNSNINRNSEIIDAIDDVLQYYKNKNLFEAYYNELEYITITNMYNLASARVATIDPGHHLLEDFHSYLLTHFPNYKKNKYIYRFSTRQKVLFFLLEGKRYRLLRALSIVRARLDGRVW